MNWEALSVRSGQFTVSTDVPPDVYALMELYPQARAYRPGIEYLPYPAVPSSTQGEKEKK